jgi:hypothetical protein
MVLDINVLRADRGGDPDFWRENQVRGSVLCVVAAMSCRARLAACNGGCV